MLCLSNHRKYTMLNQVNIASADVAANAAFQVLNVLQELPKDQQAIAVAFLYYMTCERYKLHPVDLLEKIRRVVKDAFSEGRGEHVRAIQNYVNKEWR